MAAARRFDRPLWIGSSQSGPAPNGQKRSLGGRRKPPKRGLSEPGSFSCRRSIAVLVLLCARLFCRFLRLRGFFWGFGKRRN